MSDRCSANEEPSTPWEKMRSRKHADDLFELGTWACYIPNLWPVILAYERSSAIHVCCQGHITSILGRATGLCSRNGEPSPATRGSWPYKHTLTFLEKALEEPL